MTKDEMAGWHHPMDCSLQGSSVHGIFQARVLEWGAIAFSVRLDPPYRAVSMNSPYGQAWAGPDSTQGTVPGGPVAKALCSQGIWIQSLVREPYPTWHS